MSLKYLLFLTVLACASPVCSLNVFGQTGQILCLAWDPSPATEVAGYKVHYGTASGVYGSASDAGNQTIATISGLQVGQTYFFRVNAYNAVGTESLPSNELSYQVPLPPPVVALTSPVAGATYMEPASIPLAATVTANGHTISKMQFFNGTNLLGEVSSDPYAFAWRDVRAGDYTITARAIYDSAKSVDSPGANISVTGLPLPWQAADVGSGGVAGSATYSDGTFAVVGSGVLTGTSDRFRFVYQGLSGDGEIVARIDSAQQTGAAARVGVMIRESLTAGSRHTFLGISPDGTFRSQRRSSTGGSTWSGTSGTGAPPDVWVRLVRKGGTIFSYKSANGTTWAKAGSSKISMAPNIYAGLIVASGDTNTVNVSTFRQTSVIP